MKFKKTIEDLREYANLSESYYILGKLDILEIEIQTEIANQKIQLLKKFI